MNSHRPHPLLILICLFVLVSLACQLPESTPSTPTRLPAGLPTTQPASPVFMPSDTATQTAPRSTSTRPAIHPTSPPAVAPHRIAIHRIYGLAEFYDRSNNTKFTPRGVNYFMLVPVQDHYEDRLLANGVYDHNRTQADFARLSAAGYNTVRIVFDSCTSGNTCLGVENGQGLNPAYLDNMVDLLDLAKTSHLFVLFASQGLPELGGYLAQANQGANTFIDEGLNATLLTPEGLQASQQYWSDLLVGLASRQAAFDALLGWEMLAEQYFPSDQLPFSMQNGRVSLASGTDYDMARPSQRQALAVDGLRHYIDQLKQTILAYDPTALVTMGFLTPDSPNPWREGDERFAVTAPLLENSSLDFFDLHTSPASGLSLAEVAQNFGLGSHVTKPVIMGDLGASTWSYPEISAAAIAIQDWIAASCSKGFAGWLYSTYYPFPAGLPDATWGLVDEHDQLLTALAPKNQPDACTVTVLPGRDLAKGKSPQVSAALPDQTADLAVDGDLNTQWSAGAFPTQYIEIDLGADFSIGEIRLTVGQWPEGQTVHQLWVGASRDSVQLVQQFSGYTYDFDTLDYAPATPLLHIRYVRVVTTDSPSWVSWREIEVLAPFPATPTPTPEASTTPTP